MTAFAVIDASLAIKWFVDEPSGRKAAFAVLDELCREPDRFFVPELFFNEMLSVFCRLLRDPLAIIEKISALEELGINRVGNGKELLRRAASLSVEHELTGYDAVYAATAMLVGGTWMTADGEAHRKIARLGVSRLLI